MPEYIIKTNNARFAPAATEDLLAGGRRLREVFTSTERRAAVPGQVLLGADDRDAGAVLIRRGFALRSVALSDGRRAILDVLLAGDIGGLDSIVLARAADDISAVDSVNYNIVSGAVLRELIADRRVALYLISVLAGQRWRGDRVSASIGRLNAKARICAMLLEIHDRLRHRDLIARPTFNLPLTQEQIGDYLGLTVVHVNRTLRHLREEKIVLMDRHVVIISDMKRLRAEAEGLPEAGELKEQQADSEASES